MVGYFGLAFLRGVTVFTLVELVNELGIGVFDGGRVEPASFRLRDLFRTADPAGDALALRHVAYQELLAAEFLRSPHGRDAALTAAPHPRLTEEVREFLHLPQPGHQPWPGTTGSQDDCVVPAGVYLVGPGHHLMLRRVATAGPAGPLPGHRRPLQEVPARGRATRVSQVGPPGHACRVRPPAPARQAARCPGTTRIRAYDNHPAVAVSWWSAYAFARSEGKRLPSSLEWEAAARGFDGRLFPWGDEVDISVVNCADSWSDHPLITYARVAGGTRPRTARGGAARPGRRPPGQHLTVRRPGDWAGNVWEWTATVLDDLDEAVVCGGSFDNPYRAVQASSKGTYRRRGTSNVVGFRCAAGHRHGHPRHPDRGPAPHAAGHDRTRVSVSGTSPATATPRPDPPPSRVPTWSATTIPASPTPSATPTSSPKDCAASAPDERVRFLIDHARPWHARYVIRLDLPDIESYYQ